MAILTKGKEEVEVPHDIDVAGWIDAGWKLKENKPVKETKKD